MRLGLGSAQFGFDYGISNQSGRPSEREVAAILALAAKIGVEVIDTAAAYGESEDVLGRVLWPGHPFHVITKTVPIRSERILKADITSVRTSFLRSLERLRLDRVYGLLVHHSE